MLYPRVQLVRCVVWTGALSEQRLHREPRLGALRHARRQLPGYPGGNLLEHPQLKRYLPQVRPQQHPPRRPPAHHCPAANRSGPLETCGGGGGGGGGGSYQTNCWDATCDLNCVPTPLPSPAGEPAPLATPLRSCVAIGEARTPPASNSPAQLPRLPPPPSLDPSITVAPNKPPPPSLPRSRFVSLGRVAADRYTRPHSRGGGPAKRLVL